MCDFELDPHEIFFSYLYSLAATMRSRITANQKFLKYGLLVIIFDPFLNTVAI